jgi:hypothetical protein
MNGGAGVNLAPMIFNYCSVFILAGRLDGYDSSPFCRHGLFKPTNLRWFDQCSNLSGPV